MKTVLLALTLLISINLFSMQVDQTIYYEVNKDFIEVTYSIPEELHQTFQKDQIYITIDPITEIQTGELIYPEGELDEHGLANYYDKVTLKLPYTLNKEITGDGVKVTANWQFCTESGMCLFPESTDFTIPSTTINPFVADEPVDFGLILKFLLFAFLGGFILNLMPCVFPVLSINAMRLVNQSDSSKKEVARSSMMYTVGVITSFIILALVIILVKTSGESVGWGFQFQSPFFNLALLTMIFLFALSLFDVFLIRAPGMQLATKASSKEGSSGAFFNGIFAVLLATPCTAPLLGAALGFAFAQPPLLIILIFISIGFGLSLPFILLGFFPKLIKVIPRPGNWMIIFKEVMGFLLLLTALYLVRSLFYLVGGANLIRILLYLLILGFGAWLYGSFVKPQYSRKKQWIYTFIALIFVVTGAVTTLKFPQTETTITLDDGSYKRDGWQKFSPELVSQLRSDDKAIFIRFSAEWCLTCKKNETAVLFTKEIEKLFEDNEVELLLGDYTKKDEVITEWLQKFNRAGVPLYVYYAPGKDAVILPEVIYKSTIYKLFE